LADSVSRTSALRFSTPSTALLNAMTTTSLNPACQLNSPRSSSWFRRLSEYLSAPSIRDLDAATLKDIGASEEARAQAELRGAYRQWFSPSRLQGF
jgi:hypothetical protein